MMRHTSIAIVVILLIASTQTVVWGTVSCHCFQDRAFDPARPSAADSYFLATTQNSLIAATLSVSKRNIVQSKMGGADADLLWVVYYVADRSGLDIADMLEIWLDSGVDGLLTRSDQFSLKFDRQFLAALKPQADLQQLARGAYYAVMTGQLGVDPAILDRLEISGANRQEQVLSIFVSLLLAEDPADVYGSVKSGQQTWGQAFSSTGIEPGQIEDSWRKLQAVHRKGTP